MKASIITIGNSRGLRLPKPILEQCGFENEVEIEVRNNELIIRRARQPRHDWEESFKAMAEKGDDLLMEFPEGRWDEEEWEWR